MKTKPTESEPMTVIQYIESGGWNYASIEYTAQTGVTEIDLAIVGTEGAKKLLAYCKARVSGSDDADKLARQILLE
jgi:hypothetical protein